MIHFEGVEAFATPPAALFPKLADAGFLAGCLPDAEVSEATPDRAVWKQKPKLSFVAGALESTLVAVSRTPDTLVKFAVAGKGVGASSTVEAVLTLTPDGGGTRVAWTADVTSLGGLLKMVPRGLIQSAAQKIIADVWAAVRARVEPPSAT